MTQCLQLVWTMFLAAVLCLGCKQRRDASNVRGTEVGDDPNWDSYTEESLDKGGGYDEYQVTPETQEAGDAVDVKVCKIEGETCGANLEEEIQAPLMSGVRASNQLTIFAMRSPKGIAWTSPRDLLNSTVGNGLGRPPHPIGHVMAEVYCADGGDGRPAYYLTGMSDVNSAQNTALLLAQAAGLDFLFHSFPGRLQTDDEIRKDLFRYLNNGDEGNRVAQLTHLISPATCKRLVRYFAEYQREGVQEHYGLSLRPLYKEGAGCSAFGASFLETAGLLSSEYSENWTTTIRVPYRFMKSGRIEEGRILQRAPLRRIELFGGSWANADENHRPLTFWNPDKMQAWMSQQYRSGKVTTMTHRGAGQVPIVVIDSRKVATPAGNIFKN